MSELFSLGILVGLFSSSIIYVACERSYKRTLLHCAKAQTPEKLIDGKFYYIIEESEYIALQYEEYWDDDDVENNS